MVLPVDVSLLKQQAPEKQRSSHHCFEELFCTLCDFGDTYILYGKAVRDGRIAFYKAEDDADAKEAVDTCGESLATWRSKLPK